MSEHADTEQTGGLSWRDVKALSEAIECLECGQLGPCVEAEHSEHADPEVPCTCLGCSAAARGKWIAQELRSGRMPDADVPRDAVYDLLVLALCNATGKSRTERVATDTCPACQCKTCRAFGNVDRWLYEGREGIVRNERTDSCLGRTRMQPWRGVPTAVHAMRQRRRAHR